MSAIGKCRKSQHKITNIIHTLEITSIRNTTTNKIYLRVIARETLSIQCFPIGVAGKITPEHEQKDKKDGGKENSKLIKTEIQTQLNNLV